MGHAIFQAQTGVTLAGGAPFGARRLADALALAPRLVAADSGANRLIRLGHTPEAVIGDMDSISDRVRAQLGPARLIPIAEQATTDFDKALRSIDAPFLLGLGFSGARLDHELAVLSVLARYPDRRVVIVGRQDLIFLAPCQLRLDLPIGTRLSLYPLAPVRGTDHGLAWPIAGIDFHPCGMIGTSNRTIARDVRLEFDVPRMLVILPQTRLKAVLAGLGVLPDAGHGQLPALGG